MDVYDQVLQRDGAATQPALREQVAKALVNKGFTLRLLGREQEAVDVYDQVLQRDGAATQPALAALALGNLAYTRVLLVGQHAQGHRDAAQALAIGEAAFSHAGLALLRTLLLIEPAGATPQADFFASMGKALATDDKAVWTDYLDDLQALLAYAINQGWGAELLGWMEGADYPLKQAPLYHAVYAAVWGADHLLQTNAETRAPAERIYGGLAKSLARQKALAPAEGPAQTQRKSGQRKSGQRKSEQKKPAL
jgi:hypothetical protein